MAATKAAERPRLPLPLASFACCSPKRLRPFRTGSTHYYRADARSLLTGSAMVDSARKCRTQTSPSSRRPHDLPVREVLDVSHHDSPTRPAVGWVLDAGSSDMGATS